MRLFNAYVCREIHTGMQYRHTHAESGCVTGGYSSELKFARTQKNYVGRVEMVPGFIVARPGVSEVKILIFCKEPVEFVELWIHFLSVNSNGKGLQVERGIIPLPFQVLIYVFTVRHF